MGPETAGEDNQAGGMAASLENTIFHVSDIFCLLSEVRPCSCFGTWYNSMSNVANVVCSEL